jgi:hypothetical protein
MATVSQIGLLANEDALVHRSVCDWVTGYGRIDITEGIEPSSITAIKFGRENGLPRE